MAKEKSIEEIAKNWQKIQAIWTALNRKKMFFTGLTTKTYIKNLLLETDKNFSSSAINSGKWSAYCHHSLSKSFENLIEKHEINKDSKVLIHPLTNPELVQIIRKIGVEIVFFDLSIDTLNFDPKLLADFVAQNPVNLIIHTSFNGLTEEICEFVKISKERGWSNMLILEDEVLNPATINLLENLSLGSVIIKTVETFTKQELSDILEVKLEESKWFISWFFEHRTRSILEYKLGSKEKNYTLFLEAILYLRLKQHQKYDFFARFLTLFLTSFVITSKLNSDDEAKLQIIENYEQITDSAVPDIVFEIENINSYTYKKAEKYLINTGYKLAKFDSVKGNEKQHNIKNLHNRVLAKQTQEIVIPQYFPARHYSGYFFYGTATAWQTLDIDAKATLGWSVDDQIDQLDLPNTHQIIDQLIFIK